ncbi:MAG: Amuc_1100 family pilus-like protein [Candidatus Omnitrophica bacterium]|nr:Amuc_1100 family pilus-like protein [Candidatus Omnitrophota bacterium]
MEIFLIKKFKKTFAIIGLIGIFCAVLIVAIIAAGLLNSSLNLKLGDLEKKLIVYKKTLGSNPEQMIASRKTYKSQLLNKNEQINSMFTKANFPSSTPLSFKQLLFVTQDRLKAKSLKKNITLPLGLGFDEYKINVPEADITDVLTQELSVVEELINGAIDSGVSSIDNIKLSHQKLSLAAGEQSFRYLPISLSIKSGSGQMKAFLMNISKMPGVFVIKQLKVKNIEQNKNLLSTDITLKFIEI